MSRFTTRKDVARILELSIDVVRKNERRLGLDLARIDVNPRLIRYNAEIATRELKRRHLLPD